MRRIVAFFVLLVALLLLTLRLYWHFSSSDISSQSEIVFNGRILSEVESNSFSQSFNIDYKGHRVYVNTPLYPTLRYGDKVNIAGVVEEKELEKRKIWVMSDPQLVILPENVKVFEVIYDFREKVIRVYQSYLPPNEASLLLGIVFGIKESFSPEFYEDLRNAGVLHVIAASGMNVSMLGAFLAGFFGIFLRRQIAITVTICGIFLYTVLGGFEPSIVRAALMGSLAFSAQILGRQSWALLGIVISAFVMLMASPGLIVDIGFQLSFLATLGIIYISPLIEKKLSLKKKPLVKFIGEDLETTLSAQAATLPILLVNFGRYSAVSVIVNVLVLWTVPLLMIIGGIISLLIVINESFGVFLYLALPLLWYFGIIVDSFGTLGAQIELLYLPWQISVAYFIFLVALVIRKTK